MDLRNDIKKATALPVLDSNAKFYLLQELSQAAKDKKMNERPVKKPRNLHLLEGFGSSESDNMDVNICSRVKPTFDKHGISVAVKEVNGGRDLSNKHWEESFLRNLKEMQCEKDISQNSSKYDNIKVNQPRANNLNDKCIKQKDKLYRNAAIMGLLKTNKISLQDLIMNENPIRKKDELETMHENAFNGCTDSDKCHVESVPLHEDPDICVHPLQMGIDEKQYKNIDFSIPRIGKKIKVTPQEHFLGATDDASFNFVKKKDNSI
ncbi:PREDICTED: uncharacterized protein LOC108758833 isoform X2 [Trachymyrmex cornetzi]|uniref:Uncharacterized protein n=2 Tax=Trachymyrmex cornetzi TaxID=471704 RepID=A0A195EC72_9HYME|nr:PREDICTED: uncharacterized protein LOC108758833 isoform X2 [Trachymyrmex cornetzi]XP_018359488.1 PREDICTED: uncharacterized protein LOC108758833 isoform X2 [Trachymyrmex cornetzi]XP_018359489.1 PREDICTED: uncharacterized protein LOC108758833 isoform X2 [Trachymyrmex cornetzi]KYN22711.1 hypothetical protein ALC57_04490 [Trachymyrmex cornetzi]